MACCFKQILTATFVLGAAIGTAANADQFGDLAGKVLGRIIVNEINKAKTQPPSNAGRTGTTPRPQATPAPVNPHVRNEPAMSRGVKQQVQSVLNLKNHNAGTEDGVFGRGTRAAIGRYQAAMGFAVTGYLTQPQLSQLTADYTAALDTGGAEAPRLVSKPDLRVLQTALKQLGYYNSGIDGVIGRGTARAINNYLLDRGENPDTVKLWEAVVMAANETGLRTTLSAGAPTIQPNTTPLQAPAPQATRFDLAQSSSDYIHMKARGGTFTDEAISLVQDLGERVALNIVASRPEVLEQPGVVEHWFKTRFQQQKKSDPRFSWDIYNKANFLAKEAILEEFAGSLLERAQITPRISEESPVYLAMYDVVNTGNFMDGKGLNFGSVRFGGFQFEADVFHPALSSSRRSYRLVFDPTFASPPHLPFDRARAAEFLDQNKGKGLVAVYWIKLTGFDDQIGDGKAKYEVERLTLHAQNFRIHEVPLMATKAPVFEWPIKDGELVQNLEAEAQRLANLEATARSGIMGRMELAFGQLPIREGRLAAFSRVRGQDPNNIQTYEKSAGFWVRYHAINKISMTANPLDDRTSLRHVAQMLLTEQERQDIVPGRGMDNFFTAGEEYAHAQYDAFQLRDIYSKLRTAVEPRFIEAAKLSQTPVDIYTLEVADLGTYDFEQNSFPINFRGNTDPLASEIRLRSSRDYMQVFHEGFIFPKELKMSPEEASALRARVAQNQPLAFVVRGTLTPPHPEQGANLFRITDVVATLYEDIEATTPLAVFEATPTGAPTAPGDGLALAAVFDDVTEYDGKLLIMNGKEGYQRINAALLLSANPDVLDDNLAALQIATRMLTTPEQQLIWGGSQFPRLRDLNPFEMNDAAARVRTQFTDVLMSRAISLPQEIMIDYPTSVGEYDFEQNMFPLNSRELSGTPVAWTDAMLMGLTGGYGDLTLPTILKMPADQAAQIYDVLKESGYTQIWVTSKFSAIENLQSTGADRVGQQLYSAQAILEPQSISIRHSEIAQPLLELSVDNIADAQLPVAVAQGDAGEIAAIPVSTQQGLLSYVGHMLGNEDAFKRIVETQNSYLAGNDFERARALEGKITQLRDARPDELWITGGLELGSYQFSTKSFDVEVHERSGDVDQDNHSVLEFSAQRSDPDRYASTVKLELVGETPFANLPVDPNIAEALVTEGRRDVRYLLHVKPELASLSDQRSYYDNGPKYDVLARYLQAIFYVEDSAGEIRIIARLTPEPELISTGNEYDFTAFSNSRNLLDHHVVHLIMAENLDDLMLDRHLETFFYETWRSEHLGIAGGGPQFFTKGEPQPDNAGFAARRNQFKVWFKAKAAAMGPDLTIVDKVGIHIAGTANCLRLEDVTGLRNWRPSEGVLAAGYDMAADFSTMDTLAKQTEGQITAPRLYFGQTGGRPSADERHCLDEWWSSLMVVHDVPLPPMRSGYSDEYHVRETDVTLTGAEVFFDRANLPLIRMTADGVETRFLMLDQNSKYAVIAQASVDGAGSAAVDQPAIPETPTEIAELPPAKSAIEIAPVPVATPEPTVKTAEPKQPSGTSFDILDVHIGDNMADATNILRARKGLNVVYETIDEPAADNANPYIRLFVYRSGHEALAIVSDGPDGQIASISRKLSLADSVLPDDLVENSLTSKYGEIGVHSPDQGLAGWNTGPNDAGNCLYLPEGRIGNRSLQILNGDGSKGMKLVLEDVSLSMPGLQDFPVLGDEVFEFSQTDTNCGDMLQFRAGPDGPDGKKRSFTMLMINYDAFTAMVDKEPAPVVEDSIEF